jgi:hypothetical protein
MKTIKINTGIGESVTLSEESSFAAEGRLLAVHSELGQELMKRRGRLNEHEFDEFVSALDEALRVSRNNLRRRGTMPDAG